MAANELINIKANLDVELVPVRSILPAHVPYERFANAAAVALASNNDLYNADHQSVINALTACAKDGLIPDNREAAMVVYKKKQANGDWKLIAQYMPMIDGVLKRARQSGEISIIAARAVYEKDKFRVWLDDSGEHIHYEPTLGSRGEMIGSVAYARMKTGEFQFEWLNLDDIEKVRAASKNSDKGPWVDWYESMARKSAAHRLCRRLPNNSEIMEMLEQGTEMVWQREKDITPPRASLKDFTAAQDPDAPESAATSQESTSSIDALANDLRDQIENANDTDRATAIRAEIESKKSVLGTALFTELKNNAVRRFHMVDARNQIEAEINSLPQPDEPGAIEKFAALEKSLAAAKRKLGDELHDQFAVTLCDMKPEYINS
ncbi:hypothetical protein EO763_12480 [Pectobacterium odoriferum]|uniref:recombinase RecT n=1 Tax=Pectobacterium odoriferum TaxID=78398 RepID=UPI00137421EF|nr:recombinase RecT [Pectobacterium odoriferum]QHP80680.1 hypothetical protein EO763_12480 [Pectobacterium odoriferum]